MSEVAMMWAGCGLAALFTLFMLGASIFPKLSHMAVAEDTMKLIGWPPGYAFMIGLIELGCLILFLLPRTSMLGAVLMTGLLGGAIASQLRAEQPLLTHVLFGLYLGLAMWCSLWLRSSEMRVMFPFRLG